MDTNTLRGKRILLTGATGSLGQETALALLLQGASLLLPVRNTAKAQTLQQALTSACPEADFTFLPLDLSDENSVTALAEQLLQEALPLDAIIHNAGVFTKTEQKSPQGLEWHEQVNAASPLLLTQRLLPLLKKASDPAVVTVTSLSAFIVRKACPDAASPTKRYASSKRLLLNAMEKLSSQETGIRFVYAHPGVSATGLFTGGTHRTAYDQRFLKAVLPLMKVLFPSPEKACRTTLAALQTAQSGQLAEPGGFLHIWGKPKMVMLQKRL